MYYPLLERAENKRMRSNLNAYMFIMKKVEKSVGGLHGVQAKSAGGGPLLPNKEVNNPVCYNPP